MQSALEVSSTKRRDTILVDAEAWSQPHSCEFRDGYLFVSRPCDIEWGTRTYGKKENRITYARKRFRVGGKLRVVLLHRLLADALATEFVDHRNQNGLDNRRENLRECSHTSNMQNRRRNSGHRFKGVRLVDNCKNRWRAEIKANGQRFYLGSYGTQEAAAAAYDEAARKYHGEFASLNFN